MPRTMDLEKTLAEVQLQIETNPDLRIQAMSRIPAPVYAKLLEKSIADDTVLSHTIAQVCEEFFNLKEQAGSLNLNSTGKQYAKALSELLGIDPADAVRYVFEQKALECLRAEIENRKQIRQAVESLASF